MKKTLRKNKTVKTPSSTKLHLKRSGSVDIIFTIKYVLVVFNARTKSAVIFYAEINLTTVVRRNERVWKIVFLIM